MRDAMAWITLATVLVMGPALLMFGMVHTFSRKPVEQKYQGTGGGLGGAFDAIWIPSAHEAGMERDRQTRRTAPAPAPGDPPDRIEDGRIVLDI
ncbi:hypothetical protein [Microbacterium sp.]|uniref:hypothetical protein n=1 Tax=Microbacterium sp. TaxID=51671 RepID=UPI002811ADE1|nr:hypothetical protein [Microbacterium sp.]